MPFGDNLRSYLRICSQKQTFVSTGAQTFACRSVSDLELNRNDCPLSQTGLFHTIEIQFKLETHSDKLHIQ